ncbi:hypothetical protein LCGC14_1036180 [marine sediment metagenome]|uniref:Uncharacterized protein n=1 Tax=marine sediment metagenome TaxID=412755 RepID=A0A0F9MT54_9ZZZZ
MTEKEKLEVWVLIIVATVGQLVGLTMGLWIGYSVWG